jgi:hypothetical protein
MSSMSIRCHRGLNTDPMCLRHHRLPMPLREVARINAELHGVRFPVV